MKGYTESNLSHSSMNGQLGWHGGDWWRLACHRGLTRVEPRARSSGVFVIQFSPLAPAQDGECDSGRLVC
jgi:hypothetical protein